MTRPGSPQQWFTVLERYHPTTCTISDLIVGNAYSFRVFSENQCGLSASAATTKELARIQKAGGSGPGARHQTRPALLPSNRPPTQPGSACPGASAPLPVGSPWVPLTRASAALSTPTPQLRTRSRIHTRDYKEMDVVD